MSNSVSFVRLMKVEVWPGLSCIAVFHVVLPHWLIPERSSFILNRVPRSFPISASLVKVTGKSSIGTIIYTLPLSFSFISREFLPEKWYYRRFFLFWSNMSCYTVISTSFLAVHPEKTAAISRRHYWFPREMTSEQRVQKFHTDG